MEGKLLPETEEDRLQAEHRAHKSKKGFMLIGLGAVTLLSSFVLTYLAHVDGHHPGFALFGLTTVGALLLFAGLVYVFE